MKTKLNWTSNDSSKSAKEGWILSFVCNTIYKYPITFGETGIAQDKAAFELVIQKAKEGSEFHQKALLIIMRRRMQK